MLVLTSLVDALKVGDVDHIQHLLEAPVKCKRLKKSNSTLGTLSVSQLFSQFLLCIIYCNYILSW